MYFPYKAILYHNLQMFSREVKSSKFYKMYLKEKDAVLFTKSSKFYKMYLKEKDAVLFTVSINFENHLHPHF
jgi:hypothetical protein